MLTRFAFYTALLVSFFCHLGFRGSHFQECDSTLVYDVIKRFPVGADEYAQWSYVPSSSNAWKDWRGKLIQSTRGDNLPYCAQAALALPWSSTYAPGLGLIYSLVTGQDTTIEKFFSRVQVLNILLFHLAVFIFYHLLLLAGLEFQSALLASLCMLFSISFYSYSFHLGSTIWHVTTSIFWLFLFQKDAKSKKRDRNISFVSGFFLFFNYLIVFYWLAFSFLRIGSIILSERRFRNLIAFATSQWFFFLSVIVFVGLFFQPGQGNRGSASGLSEWLAFTYYIILNFTSFYNKSEFFDKIQFGVGILILILGISYLIKAFKALSQVRELALFSFLIILVYSLGVNTGLLGYAPSRHILFLGPIFFFFIALGFQFFNSMRLARVLVFVLIFFGFWGIHERQKVVSDQSRNISPGLYRGLNKIIIQDCSFDLVYRLWPENPVVEFADPANFRPGEKYFYVSQTTSIETAIDAWKAALEKRKLIVTYNQKTSVITNQYFIAYNPAHYPHNRPNNVYMAEVSVEGTK